MSSMITPVCTKCGREMKCVCNDYSAVHFIDNDQDKGMDFFVRGDRYECPSCKVSIVTGFGEKMYTTRKLPVPYTVIIRKEVKSGC